jgi:dynein heavy chain, axonemal
MTDAWLRDVTEGCLDFTTAEWNACLDDHSTPRRNGNALDDFMGGQTGKGTSLFIYTLTVEEVKETKVKRRREVPASAGPSAAPTATNAVDAAAAAAPADGAAAPAAPALSDAAIQETKEKEAADAAAPAAAGEAAAPAAAAEAAAAAAEGAPPAATSPETPPEGSPPAPAVEGAGAAEEKKDEEAAAAPLAEPAAAAAAAAPAAAPRYIDEEVIERVVTHRSLLQASLRSLPEGVHGVPAVFFIKNKDGALSPPGDVNEYMADTVEYGTFAPDMLGSIDSVVRHVYTPFLEPHLGGRASGGDGTAAAAYSGIGGGAGGGGAGDDGDGTRDDDASQVSGGVGGGVGAGAPGAQSVRSGGSSLNPRAASRAGGVKGGAVQAGPSAGSRHVPAPDSEDKDLTGVTDSVRGEFKSALTRFATVITQTIQQLSADVRITLPALTIGDPAVAAQEQAVLLLLVEAVESWTRTVASVCAPVTEADKGARPLQEVEFWRGRNARLSTVYDALQQPAVKTMLAVLDLAREPLLDVFKAAFTELSHAYVESRDNVKFLNTLERHFKNLGAGSLSVVSETLPSLLNGLRMVWTISRHYNTDDTMLPLMKRIVNELTDKVASEANVKYVLRVARQNPGEALHTMAAARGVLDGWHTTYMAVRERIERSTDHRWEFDRRVLFERTDHMSAVISDMERIVSVTTEYAKFFRGNELKAITNDPAALNAIVRLVDRLTAPLTRLHYSVYDKVHHSKWRAEVQGFDEKVADIERRTELFIKQAFAHLRSAEGAFDLLAKFDKMEMRDSIRALLEGNMSNIVAKARGELAAAVALFEAQRASPPLTKNSPPVAGAIAWANALYLRQKRPVVKFRTVPALFASAEGQLLKAEYLAFARSVDAYIRALYSSWCDEAKRSAAELLRQPILSPPLLKEAMAPAAILALAPAPGSAAAEADREKDGTARSLRLAAASAAAAVASYPALLAADKDAARMPPPPYAVNLSKDLLTLIREAKLLDRMGYKVPEAAMSAALQEDTLNDYTARLNAMLERYHGALAALTPAEANLLQVQLARLRTSLRPGFAPLNWNSLHVSAYISEVGKALQDFDSVLSQVRKSCSMVEDAVTTIAAACLLEPAEVEGKECMDVSEVVDIIDRQRATRLEALVAKYKSVKPVMQQIEGIIAGTDTCASPALAEFYRYWERRFYNAVTRMILTSMATLEALLNAVAPPAGSGVAPYRRSPLCRIRASYAAPDFVLSPDLNFITKSLRRAVHNLIKSAQGFTRWMDGTCLEVEVQVPPGEQRPDFSYFEDVKQNPEVVAMLMTLNPAVIRMMNNVKRFTGNWSKYGAAYHLWAPRKPEAEKKLVEKAPPAVYFDTRLATYARLAEGVDALAVTKDIGFLRVDCYAVAVAVKAQANKLKAEYGRALREIGRKTLDEFTGRVGEMRTAIDVKPQDLAQLKAVLSAVALVADSKVEMELLAADVAERYRTLGAHGVEVDEAELAAALAAAQSWQDTVDAALTKDARLVKVKEKFRAVTKDDVAAFVAECDAAKKDFVSSGPTSPGITLAAGLQLLADYRARLAEYNKRREAFTQAERLFALPMTRYLQLQDIKDEIDRVAPLYDLYSEQVAFAESKASMLWADLDVSSLQKGADELHKRLGKLKDLKGSSVYASVFDEVNGFRESLPLIASLKNPAMKERHWEKISQMTGIKINMNPKTFTLGGIFAMKLERFSEAINEIVNEAKQEGKIEKDLRAIQDKWAVTNFTVTKYAKNGEVRGHILKASDDLKVELDENLLNLQAMAGSRFLSIFASTVSEWEKKLNVVSETMDVWSVVQTKWQYLEGIFQSEDIRQQLPEEAKRFGAIDKDFKGIMSATAKNPNVVDACCEPGRLDILRGLGEKLDNCQKSLSEYLNTKRNAFARFYFISDDELLSVLGSSDPTSIRVHLLKLFDNVKDFGFGRGNKAVTTLASSEGEGFPLRDPSPVEGAVEGWMTAAEAEMKKSLHSIVKEGVFNYAHTPRLSWVAEQLGMTVCVGSQIWWTWETEDVFRRVRKGDKHAMKNFAERQTKQLLDLVAKVRDNIPKLHRVKVNTLLIVDVHARDIIDSFVRDSILDAREFAWESQLRFYWNKDIDDVVISQCTGNFRYGFEYMGLNGRLVITPLTDRCYMTLTQALTFNLGGAPAGPAGTGKTETTKDLAKNLAIPCFVINCALPSVVSRLSPRPPLYHPVPPPPPPAPSIPPPPQAARASTSAPWAPSSPACARSARGAASTSSTASPSRCSPSCPRRSRRSRTPSSTRSTRRTSASARSASTPRSAPSSP